jgi:hypothetical protein
VNVRGEVHAYLPPEHYRRLKLEAAARQVSLSLCVAQCLGEYFTLREEMATALETPTQPGELSRRVIHVLLAETEQRLVATFERYVDDLVALRGGVDALLAMADRAALLTLDQTPEVPPAARARVPSSSPRRFAHWRHAVTRMLQASGRPVPWPLADPEASTHCRPQRAAMAVSNDPGTSPEPLPIESGSRPTEQDDTRYPKVATPPGRPTHGGLPPRTPDSSALPPDPVPNDAGLRTRLTRLVSWGRATGSPRPR